MQKLFLYLAIFFVLLYIFYPWLMKFPWGRLPGDIVIERENFKLYFPITTMILISLLLSLLFQLIIKLRLWWIYNNI